MSVTARAVPARPAAVHATVMSTAWLAAAVSVAYPSSLVIEASSPSRVTDYTVTVAAAGRYPQVRVTAWPAGGASMCSS